MARDSTITLLRTTRANLNSQASAGGLFLGEPYLITDEGRIAIATGTSAFSSVALQAEGGVVTVAGRAGNVTLTAADVGLGNVNNTSDANKPVSTATAAAIAVKTGKYSASIGDGVTTTFTVTHNLNSTDVVVGVKDTNGLTWYPDITTTGANTVSVAFASAPASNGYRVTVIG